MNKKKPLVIYHGNCADGFGAAWAAWKRYGDTAEYYPGFYGKPPPADIAGRHIMILDFSYRRNVMEEMAKVAESLAIIDHHKTAFENVEGFAEWALDQDLDVETVFDMEKSGAVLAWEYFHPATSVPELLRHIQDRDLWRFHMEGTREIQACVFSYPYEFDVWEDLVQRAAWSKDWLEMVSEGRAIERKQAKDIAELLPVVTRSMLIGGHLVPVANLPYTLASDAGNWLCRNPGFFQTPPFAAIYYDTADGRVFSLRSIGEFDVSEIAKKMGGGGHRNAAGFTAPCGWEGDDR